MARLSLFCTTLSKITCQRRQADASTTSDLWSVHCDAPAEASSSGPGRVALHLRAPGGRVTFKETWYIRRVVVHRSSLPEDIRHMLRKERFTLTLIAASTAPVHHSRILASVPMPVVTSLPVHISAPFVVASDRRSLRYEPPDASGARTAGSAFNSFILEHVVPSAYLDLLEQLACTLAPQYAKRLWEWWPRFSDDKVTHTVTTAVYSQLRNSTQRILPTASGQFTSARSGVICLDTSDTASYAFLLDHLHPDDLSCPPPRLQKHDAFAELTHVSPEYARRVLLQKERSLERQITAQQPALHPGVESVLAYLLDGSTTLDSLKLLPLHSGDIGRFGEVQNYYALRTTAVIPSAFSSSLFVDSRLTRALRERLVGNSTNVRFFDVVAVRELLGREILPQETMIVNARVHQLLITFWDDFLANRIPARFEELQDLPLLRADTPPVLCYVSFSFCLSGRALLRPSHVNLELTELMRDLSGAGLQFLYPGMRELIPRQNRPALEFTLANLMNGLRQLGNIIHTFSRVRNQVHFATWIRDNLSATSEISGLEQLPIWTAHSNSGPETLVAAEDLYMLPQTWSSPASVRALAPFLPNGISWAAYDARLARVLPAHRRLSTSQAFERLVLPGTISASRLPDLEALLRLLRPDDISYPRAFIPDGQRILHHPNAMFDHRVALFAAAFHTSALTKFIHPDLRRSIGHVTTLGVRNAVNFETFMEAIQAVDSDFVLGATDMTRTEQVFGCFLEELPQTLQGQEFSRWPSIRTVRFVPRTTGQVRGLAFDANPYILEMDDIVTPGDVVREEFETIAWTQCARLTARLQPPRRLIVAFPEFGQPSTQAVVSLTAGCVAPTQLGCRSIIS